MESIQSYYLYKLKHDNRQNREYRNGCIDGCSSDGCKHNSAQMESYRRIYQNAILWAKESMRLLLSYRDIQQNILMSYFPQLSVSQMKSFETYSSNDRIYGHCEQIVNDTHTSGIHLVMISKRQIIIIEKTFQEVYVLDPTGMLRHKSIHDTQFLEEKLFPMFSRYGYAAEFVKLTYPAVIEANDPYIETWLIILLLDCIQQLNLMHTIDTLVIPDKTHEKHEMMMEFHREILQYKYIQNELMSIFLDHINHNKYSIQTFEDLEFMLDTNPTELVLKFNL